MGYRKTKRASIRDCQLPRVRRSFAHLWDEIVYVHSRLLYLYCVRDQKSRARRLLPRLKKLLDSDPDASRAILGIECMAMIAALKGRKDEAMRLHKKHVALVDRIVDTLPTSDYGPRRGLVRLLWVVQCWECERYRLANRVLQECARLNFKHMPRKHDGLRRRMEKCVKSSKERLLSPPIASAMEVLRRETHLEWAMQWQISRIRHELNKPWHKRTAGNW